MIDPKLGNNIYKIRFLAIHLFLQSKNVEKRFRQVHSSTCAIRQH